VERNEERRMARLSIYGEFGGEKIVVIEKD
jgi:hypothetical protein